MHYEENPTTGIAGFCARAASGHAAAAPPSAANNSRRPMVTVIRPSRARCAQFDLPPGKVEELMPGVRRLLANNPSPFTFRGTVSYIVGRGRVAIIDPGPLDEAHIAAMLHAVRDGGVVLHLCNKWGRLKLSLKKLRYSYEVEFF